LIYFEIKRPPIKGAIFEGDYEGIIYIIHKFKGMSNKKTPQ